MLLLPFSNIDAQRKMTKLSRGVIALNKGGGQVYIGWRMLGTDPSDIAFNLYRSTGGATAVKIAGPITATTDYTATGINTASSNSFFVKPIINGVEQSASAPFILTANAPIRRYLAIPQQNEPDGGPYTSWQVHVGDVDGDGEYEYICMRDYMGTGAARTHKIDCYKLDGTLLWRLDEGWNFTYTANGTGSLVVADFNGDGKDEVALRTFEGTCFRYGSADSTRIGDTDGDGKTNYLRSDGFVNNGPEFLSVLEGATGKELARTPYQPSNGGDAWAKYGPNERPLYIYLAVAYLDGVLPSIVSVRGVGGDNTPAFAFDYRNGHLTERWRWIPGVGEGLSQAHNILVYDLDNDGKDEIAFLGSALDDDGKILYANRDFTHGDHFRILDMDPDRPGYEIFSIQQNNASLIGMSINDGATGDYLKKWFMPALGDLSRGDAGDYVAGTKGAECYSTMPGLYSCKGDKISDTGRFPVWGIWWDGDLQRELINGVSGDGTNPAIDKWPTGRLFSIYSDNGSNKMPYGGHPQFWGDIFGDWREEIIVETSDYSQLRIYSTYDPAQNRLYTLMDNPGYKTEVSCKGRIGGAFPDYYLGGGMQTPPPPPMVDAKLHWKGNAGNNSWDLNTNSNWVNNRTLANFNQNDTVLFDLTGQNTTPVTLTGIITPGRVTVYNPIDYIFNGTGQISGSTTFTKVGKGTLTLNNKNTYTGKTEVWDGAFVVNDSLLNSDVSVYGGVWGGDLSKGLTGGRIGGHGYFGKSVTVEYGGAIVPGEAVGEADTLTINGLTEKQGAVNYLDFSNDPTGLSHKNDVIKVIGDLTLTDAITVSINPIDGTLSAGVYAIFKYSGTFTGNISKIKVVGLSEYPYTLVNQNGVIGISITALRPAAKVVWSGAGNNWDLGVSSNWLRNGNADIFASRDSVLFDNTGSAIKTIDLANDLFVNEVIFDGTTNYILNGNGAISGNGKLIKRGSSVVRLNGKHKYTGATIIEGGTLEIGSLDDGDAPSSIGASPATLGNLAINGAGLSLISLSSSTNRPIIINNGECTFSSISGSSMSLLGVVSGNGTLVKKGAGILQLNAINTFTGGTIVKEGRIVLGSSTANRNGLSSGSVTLEGGSLYMINVQANDVFTRNLIVPTGSNAEFGIDGRCSVTGSLTGGGTLTVYSPYVRGDLSGNWSAFTGTINATGVDFRINNSYGYPNATINLVSPVSAYKNGGGAVSLGQLSGAAGSTLSGADWTVGAKNTDAIFSGKIQGNSLTKVGTGMLTLNDTCFYTANTTVNAGTLSLNTKACIKGTLVVNNGGIVSGTGSVLGSISVNSGATIQPGTTTLGTLKVGTSLVLNSTSTTIIRLNKTAKQQDSIRVKGVTLFGGTLNLTLTSGAFGIGDSVRVIKSATYSSKFNAIVPETPGNGLQWDQSTIAKDGYIRIVSSTGINDTWANNILLLPNPVKDVLTIQLESAVIKGRIKLLSVGGNLIFNKEIDGMSKITVNMSSFASGFYMLIIDNGETVKKFKVVKN